MCNDYFTYYEYLTINDEKFFTVVLLPKKGEQFPTVVCRSPYVGNTVDESESEIVQNYLDGYCNWLKRGYAIVYQHCRGQGKSTGAFVPYIYEREDGLALLQWIRKQNFYNGELYLWGASYTASLHYCTAPFDDDIKGAVFEVQDSERYNLWYRNGQMRKGHANWHFGLYKAKCGLNKNFTINSFASLPLKGLSKTVLGEVTEDFEKMLEAQFISNEFWNTRFGGQDARYAVITAKIPILLTTGYNDFYAGGMFDMWNRMDEQTKKQSALLVSPYDHGDGYYGEEGICFPNGKRSEQFGNLYQIDWFDNIRKQTELPYQKGVITYYRTFENTWQGDFDTPPPKTHTISLGDGTRSYKYDPLHPTAFSGEGTFAKENPLDSNFIRIYTKSFERDVFIKGKMRLKLAVSCDCEDSSFYVRISIKNNQHAYVLRHDITSLCYQLGDYMKNSVVQLDFCFDEHAFLLKKDEQLQIDITATDDNVYVSHTNKKGEYYLQTDTLISTNTVYLDRSYLYLPIE